MANHVVGFSPDGGYIIVFFCARGLGEVMMGPWPTWTPSTHTA